MLGLHALNGVAILVITSIIARRAWVMAWRSTPAVATDAGRTDATATTSP
jgi:hypothetical protein